MLWKRFTIFGTSASINLALSVLSSVIVKALCSSTTEKDISADMLRPRANCIEILRTSLNIGKNYALLPLSGESSGSAKLMKRFRGKRNAGSVMLATVLIPKFLLCLETDKCMI